MNKYLLTTILAILTATVLNASVPARFRTEFRLSHGMVFNSGYQTEYGENVRSEGCVHLLYGPFFVGAGVGYDHPSRLSRNNESILFLAKTGIKLSTNRLDVDFYANLEKNLRKYEPVPPHCGIGVSFSVRVAGPAYIFGDLRTQYPFNWRYSYRRHLSSIALLGITIKF